jgi:hypothetical protein
MQLLLSKFVVHFQIQRGDVMVSSPYRIAKRRAAHRGVERGRRGGDGDGGWGMGDWGGGRGGDGMGMGDGELGIGEGRREQGGGGRGRRAYLMQLLLSKFVVHFQEQGSDVMVSSPYRIVERRVAPFVVLVEFVAFSDSLLDFGIPKLCWYQSHPFSLPYTLFSLPSPSLLPP